MRSTFAPDPFTSLASHQGASLAAAMLWWCFSIFLFGGRYIDHSIDGVKSHCFLLPESTAGHAAPRPPASASARSPASGRGAALQSPLPPPCLPTGFTELLRRRHRLAEADDARNFKSAFASAPRAKWRQARAARIARARARFVSWLPEFAFRFFFLLLKETPTSALFCAPGRVVPGLPARDDPASRT